MSKSVRSIKRLCELPLLSFSLAFFGTGQGTGVGCENSVNTVESGLVPCF